VKKSGFSRLGKERLWKEKREKIREKCREFIKEEFKGFNRIGGFIKGNIRKLRAKIKKHEQKVKKKNRKTGEMGKRG